MAELGHQNLRAIRVDEQCEVISIVGDVAKDESGKPSMHLHGVLGLKGGRTVGGHAQKLHVRPTLEVVLTETSAHLRRKRRPDLGGIALIDLGAGKLCGILAVLGESIQLSETSQPSR